MTCAQEKRGVSRDSWVLGKYAERYFRRHQMTEFPTVAKAARSLGWSQRRVEDACEDSEYSMCLSSYHAAPSPRLGEHFVEVIDKERMRGL